MAPTKVLATMLAASLALPAAAQTAAPATTSPAPAPASATTLGGLNGPLVPGLCLLSRDDLIMKSKVGEAAVARLKVLAGRAQTSIDTEKARLEASGKALSAKRATLTQQQFETEAAALQKRAQNLQTDVALRERQIELTRNRAYAQILEASDPFVSAAFGAHKCGLLFAREAALGGNFGNDLTPEVLAAFDAKGTPITVELEPVAPK
ncbi:MAG: OmpH family outer membrane protein [Caulobacteraceae bacterium]|nr:OmpH family outer membrane protein [Caulobacteraceae bacterium]